MACSKNMKSSFSTLKFKKFPESLKSIFMLNGCILWFVVFGLISSFSTEGRETIISRIYVCNRIQ